jgi:hypothetical protein
VIILKEQDGFVQTRQMLFSPLNKLPFFTSEGQKFLMILLGLCILSWLSKILPYILLLVSHLKDSKWRMMSSLETTRKSTAITTLYLVHILRWLAHSLDQLDRGGGSLRSGFAVLQILNSGRSFVLVLPMPLSPRQKV